MPLLGRSITRAVLLFVLPSVTAVAGCSAKQAMTPASGLTPDAEGRVTLERGEEDTIVAHVHVKHLATPFHLASDAKTYVVWIQPPSSALRNVGALSVDDAFEGQLVFVTPYRQFRLTITPESAATVTAPMNRPVFSSGIDARSLLKAPTASVP